MGTRGIFGVHSDGQTKVAYNHFDSYPSGLGQDIIGQLHEMLKGDNRLTELRAQAAQLRAISDGDEPTAEDIERCKPYTDLSVSGQSTQDWYCLLRNAQGKLDAMMTCGVFEDASGFAKDSLFCEYGYVANLDTSELEVYKGFQKGTTVEGRFAGAPVAKKHNPTPEYGPIKLVGTIPFARIAESTELAFADMEALFPLQSDEDQEAA